MIVEKRETANLRGSNVRVRGPVKRPIEWSRKEHLRASDTRLRGPKREFSKPSQNRKRLLNLAF